MSRMVCCYDLNKEKRPAEECWKAPNNKYYSSEEAYQKIQREADHVKKYKEQCIMLYKEWIGDTNENTVPTLYLKRIKGLKEDFEVVYEAMQLATEAVMYALNTKRFENDYNMCAYIFAIVQSNIYHAKKNIQMLQKAKAEAEKLSDKEIDTISDVKDPSVYKQQTIDVRRWL